MIHMGDWQEHTSSIIRISYVSATGTTGLEGLFPVEGVNTS